jgi:hypothetical protein
MKRAVQMWTRAAELYKELGDLETAKRITAQMRSKLRPTSKRRASHSVLEPTKQRKTSGK